MSCCALKIAPGDIIVLYDLWTAGVHTMIASGGTADGSPLVYSISKGVAEEKLVEMPLADIVATFEAPKSVQAFTPKPALLS